MEGVSNYKLKDSKRGIRVRLKTITDKILCAKCGESLILCNFQDGEQVIMVKTSIHIIDLRKQELSLKCGKCHNFNTILLLDINEGKREFCLVI
jgi:ribosomal protein S27AE